MSEARDEVITNLHQTIAELSRGLLVMTKEVDHYVRAPQQRAAMLASIQACANLLELQEQLVRSLPRHGF